MRPDPQERIVSIVIRLVGIVGVCWETLYEHIDRPYLLFLFACMMGLAKWDSISSVIRPGTRFFETKPTLPQEESSKVENELKP